MLGPRDQVGVHRLRGQEPLGQPAARLQRQGAGPPPHRHHRRRRRNRHVSGHGEGLPGPAGIVRRLEAHHRADRRRFRPGRFRRPGQADRRRRHHALDGGHGRRRPPARFCRTSRPRPRGIPTSATTSARVPQIFALETSMCRQGGHHRGAVLPQVVHASPHAGRLGPGARADALGLRGDAGQAGRASSSWPPAERRSAAGLRALRPRHDASPSRPTSRAAGRRPGCVGPASAASGCSWSAQAMRKEPPPGAAAASRPVFPRSSASSRPTRPYCRRSLSPATAAMIRVRRSCSLRRAARCRRRFCIGVSGSWPRWCCCWSICS